jgi:hypothetical protein
MIRQGVLMVAGKLGYCSYSNFTSSHPKFQMLIFPLQSCSTKLITPTFSADCVVGDLVYWQFIDDGCHITRDKVSIHAWMSGKCEVWEKGFGK